MAIGKTAFLVVLLAFGVAPLAQAETGKPLFIAADMVTGPEGSGPVCVLRSQFMRKEGGRLADPRAGRDRQTTRQYGPQKRRRRIA